MENNNELETLTNNDVQTEQPVTQVQPEQVVQQVTPKQPEQVVQPEQVIQPEQVVQQVTQVQAEQIVHPEEAKIQEELVTDNVEIVSQDNNEGPNKSPAGMFIVFMLVAAFVYFLPDVTYYINNLNKEESLEEKQEEKKPEENITQENTESDEIEETLIVEELECILDHGHIAFKVRFKHSNNKLISYEEENIFIADTNEELLDDYEACVISANNYDGKYASKDCFHIKNTLTERVIYNLKNIKDGKFPMKDKTEEEASFNYNDNMDEVLVKSKEQGFVCEK